MNEKRKHVYLGILGAVVAGILSVLLANYFADRQTARELGIVLLDESRKLQDHLRFCGGHNLSPHDSFLNNERSLSRAIGAFKISVESHDLKAAADKVFDEAKKAALSMESCDSGFALESLPELEKLIFDELGQ